MDNRDEFSRGYARYVLGMCFLLTALNVMDRQVLMVLVEPVKMEFGLSDSQMGFLTGTAFILVGLALGDTFLGLLDAATVRGLAPVLTLGLGFIGLLEVLGEAEKPHYMRGGKSGTHDLVWYFGSKYLSGKTEEQKLRSRTAEINNGRLAMIGIMGFIAASTVPGSVPYFTEDLTQYSGSVWAPF